MISILITYYNEYNLLKRCLESIQNQSLLPECVLIYDDFSTKKLLAQDLPQYTFPIKIFNGKENMGPAFGRNFLMEACKTAYFRFQDSDDELFENAVKEISKNISTNQKNDLIFNEVSSYDNNNKLYCKNVIGLSSFDGNLVNFSISNVLLIPSVTYKTSFAKTLPGFKLKNELPQSEDSDFIRRLCLRCNHFSIIDLPLAKQNLRANSHSHSNQKDVWISGLLSLMAIRAELTEHNLYSYGKKMYQIGVQLIEHKKYNLATKAFKEMSSVIKNPNVVIKSSNKRILVRILGIYYTEILAFKLRKIRK